MAHELYHIHCYAEEIDPDTIATGSLLDSKTADDVAVSQEDLEANAFAGLLLMPDSILDEQIKIYGTIYGMMPGSKDRGEGSWRGLETILTSDLTVLKSLLEYYELLHFEQTNRQPPRHL